MIKHDIAVYSLHISINNCQIHSKPSANAREMAHKLGGFSYGFVAYGMR
jgi:hypothetical protein